MDLFDHTINPVPIFPNFYLLFSLSFSSYNLTGQPWLGRHLNSRQLKLLQLARLFTPFLHLVKLMLSDIQPSFQISIVCHLQLAVCEYFYLNSKFKLDFEPPFAACADITDTQLASYSYTSHWLLIATYYIYITRQQHFYKYLSINGYVTVFYSLSLYKLLSRKSYLLRPSSLGQQMMNFTTTPDEPRGKFAEAYNPPSLRNTTESKILPLSRSKLAI